MYYDIDNDGDGVVDSLDSSQQILLNNMIPMETAMVIIKMEQMAISSW